MNFLYSHWLVLPITTRHKIAEAFGIQKKGSTEVVQNVIKSDGFLIQDIELKLTPEAMRNYVGSNSEDMMWLWKAMVDKAEGREVAKSNIDTTQEAKVLITPKELLKPAHDITKKEASHLKPKRKKK